MNSTWPLITHFMNLNQIWRKSVSEFKWQFMILSLGKGDQNHLRTEPWSYILRTSYILLKKVFQIQRSLLILPFLISGQGLQTLNCTGLKTLPVRKKGHSGEKKFNKKFSNFNVQKSKPLKQASWQEEYIPRLQVEAQISGLGQTWDKWLKFQDWINFLQNLSI